MSEFSQWQQTYAFLDSHEQGNPIQVFKDNTDGCNVFTDRLLLFNLFYAALCRDLHDDYPDGEVEDYVDLLKRLVLILEASHRLSELINKDQLRCSYVGDVATK